MSKRRSAGDVVFKVANAGFVGEAGRVVILPEDEQYRDCSCCCLDCGDPDCREWATVEEIGPDGEPTGNYAYHVAECQMEDLDDVHDASDPSTPTEE